VRRSARTTQFTARITDELQQEIKVWTSQHGMKLNEFVQRAFVALKRELEN
jgi:predicted HicB family RNase H-like nuclease